VTLHRENLKSLSVVGRRKWALDCPAIGSDADALVLGHQHQHPLSLPELTLDSPFNGRARRVRNEGTARKGAGASHALPRRVCCAKHQRSWRKTGIRRGRRRTIDILRLLALASPAASWPGMPLVHARARPAAQATRVRVLAAARDCDPAARVPARLVKLYELLIVIEDSEHEVRCSTKTRHTRARSSNSPASVRPTLPVPPSRAETGLKPRHTTA
jgi:hypothetical protein